MNALNSLNNTVPMNVCNSGQSQFLMCCKTLREEKMPSFSEGSSPSGFTPLLMFVKTQRNRTKIWLSEMEKISHLTSYSSSCELKELFQPELLFFFPFLAEVLPNQVISGKSATLPFLASLCHWERAL